MKFCEKNVLCEKGDEITRFDGTDLRVQYLYRLKILIESYSTLKTIFYSYISI